ncbi:N-acetyltransferase [Agromyces protaetiae]|uniref:N-acetyltransferase n=1 Tax=Agromyces protaetiae TaxID=2509455 RepID=A0A4P6F8P3_9MICO|nr:GNAT family N-acetyltransferase [Agromyces protaetiae]QAY72470.1 N-acetyltransferase [Agromyces protaetiae]
MPGSDEAPALRVPFEPEAFGAARFETDRLVLRALEASDAPDVWEYQRLPEVLRYIPWPERDREEGFEHTRTRAAMRRLAADGDAVIFAVELPGEASVVVEPAARTRVIGDVMLRVSSVANAQLEIGWVVHPDFQGHGYAREAAQAVLDFAFKTLRPHRVQALLDARNEASARLCERLGMRREATLLGEQYDDDEWTDTAIYAILRREWASGRLDA